MLNSGLRSCPYIPRQSRYQHQVGRDTKQGARCTALVNSANLILVHMGDPLHARYSRVLVNTDGDYASHEAGV